MEPSGHPGHPPSGLGPAPLARPRWPWWGSASSFFCLSEIWREVVQTLQSKAEVDPGFTPLVWQKLQERNQDFFQASAMRL